MEDGKDVGGEESLDTQVGELRRKFKEGTGTSGSREGVTGREKDPTLGRDPGKFKR